MLIFGEQHLRRVLVSYAPYYNQVRTRLALQKDAPLHRAVSAIRHHCTHSDTGWAASSIRPDLIHDRNRRWQQFINHIAEIVRLLPL
jgi:hypothetical protein